MVLADKDEEFEKVVELSYTVDCASAEAHDPDLYRHDVMAKPVPSLDSIGDAEIAHFHDHGWIAVGRAFADELMVDALAGFEHLASGLHPTFKGIRYEAAVRDRIDELTPEDRQDAVRKLESFVAFEPRLHALAYHADLLGVICRLADAPALTMFQDMALSKPPKIGREKPWHQDCA